MWSISARSVPSPLGQSSGSFRLEFFGGEIASGAQILAFHKRARGALRLGVCFSSLRSRPARPDLREFFNVIFPGGGCLWAQCFAIDRKSAWSSTLCGQFQLARSQARSARTPRSFRLEFFGGEIASGAQVLAFHKRARGALRLGVCFSSLRFRPARPDLREFFNVIFPGGRLPLGPMFCH